MEALKEGRALRSRGLLDADCLEVLPVFLSLPDPRVVPLARVESHATLPSR